MTYLIRASLVSSTETALLRVLNDILMCADARECSDLLLFDPSAATDNGDHSFLLSRVQ